ncbi:hypothetical protein HNY73_000579 [Argiope bruennichi]|uniref:Secreted protein n=1 Tax=Argiope bruennichi TaxID=94029 RepID=A0A8T0FZR6_ARGBR|nr:hypothetical protein HNY73_000579 [Argiope bruennichi]
MKFFALFALFAVVAAGDSSCVTYSWMNTGKHSRWIISGRQHLYTRHFMKDSSSFTGFALEDYIVFSRYWLNHEVPCLVCSFCCFGHRHGVFSNPESTNIGKISSWGNNLGDQKDISRCPETRTNQMWHCHPSRYPLV